MGQVGVRSRRRGLAAFAVPPLVAPDTRLPCPLQDNLAAALGGGKKGGFFRGSLTAGRFKVGLGNWGC